MQSDGEEKKLTTDEAARDARGAKTFALLDIVVKTAVVTLVVFGIIMAVIALSGVDMAQADEHEIFRYRTPAAVAIIVGYLLIDWRLGRRRSHRAAEAAEAARYSSAAAASLDAKQAHPKRGYAVEMMALAFVAGGGAAFWHDHITHEIPNPKAVPATFVSAACADRTYRRIGGSVAPHMSIIYEFVSLSTSARPQEMTCFTDSCESEKTPKQYKDTVEKKAFFASKPACETDLPAVLAAKSPTTVWTGDVSPNAPVRARFTPEREEPPNFLLWFPGAVAAVMLLISGLARVRSSRDA